MKYSTTIRIKFLLEGVTGFDEAARRLEKHAEYLRQMGADGIVIPDPVEDDYMYVETDDPKLAKKYDMTESPN